MNQNSFSERENMIGIIKTINQVEGFDPMQYVLDITDEGTEEVRKYLPVRAQLAWFWLKYPQGKIDVQVMPENDSFVACARVYPDFKASDNCYLAAGTASRVALEEKPSISAREWAQTAAIGVALRNAGFGLQFELVGAIPDGIVQIEDENSQNQERYTLPQDVSLQQMPQNQISQYEAYAPKPQMQSELTQEQKLQQAMNTPCPISKFTGKTLGEVLAIDPGAIKWTATKFTGDVKVSDAAKLICDYALEATA